MNNQDNDQHHFDPSASELHEQSQPANAEPAPNATLTIADIDALAREIADMPRVEKFDAKAQLARLGPSLQTMKNKGYDLAAIRNWLEARGIHASTSSVSRAISLASEKPKRAKPRASAGRRSSR